MKISEILELTKTMPIAEVAKAHLTIGEKPARAALKHAGCYSVVGQPGWFLDEDRDLSVLDRSIYDVANEVKQIQTNGLKEAANLGSNLRNEDSPQGVRKRHSFDLDVALIKELKLHCVKEDKKLYEAVETAIRTYLYEHEREDGKGV